MPFKKYNVSNSLKRKKNKKIFFNVNDEKTNFVQSLNFFEQLIKLPT
jgi:hypothetical protein